MSMPSPQQELLLARLCRAGTTKAVYDVKFVYGPSSRMYKVGAISNIIHRDKKSKVRMRTWLWSFDESELRNSRSVRTTEKLLFCNIDSSKFYLANCAWDEQPVRWKKIMDQYSRTSISFFISFILENWKCIMIRNKIIHCYRQDEILVQRIFLNFDFSNKKLVPRSKVEPLTLLNTKPCRTW